MHFIRTLPVTIVTANYNNGRYLVKYFDSILNSSAMPERIIIIDDGSTDDSMTILSKYAEKMSNLMVIKFPVNQGFANALNAGMELVTTEFIIRLDPDDWVDPIRIEAQVNFLQNNKEIGVVGSNVVYVNESNCNVTGYSNFKLNHEWIESKYRQGEYGIMHGAICARSIIFRKYKYIQKHVPAEDYALFAQMIFDGVKFANLDKALSSILVHKSSISNSLKFETVIKVFELRRQIFGINYSNFGVRCAFISRKNYRIALFTENIFIKFFRLLVAGVFNPNAVFRRLGIS